MKNWFVCEKIFFLVVWCEIIKKFNPPNLFAREVWVNNYF